MVKGIGVSGGLAFAIRDCGGIYPDVKYPQVYRFSFINDAESKFPAKLLNVVTGFKVQIEVFPVIDIDEVCGLKYFKSYFYVFECRDDYIVISKHKDLHTSEYTPDLLQHFKIGEFSVVVQLAEYAYMVNDCTPSTYLFTNDGHQAYLV